MIAKIGDPLPRVDGKAKVFRNGEVLRRISPLRAYYASLVLSTIPSGSIS